MACVHLKRGRANPLWHGHPWIYSGAIDRQEGECEAGGVVDVRDHDGRWIGRGFWNPSSQVRVRMVTRGEEEVGPALISERVEGARRLRLRLGLPAEETTCYRLVNSEGDGLPGAVVDVYGEVAAVQLTALGMKRREEALYDALARLPGIRSVVEVAAGHFAQVEGFASSSRTVRGPEVGLVRCRESGVELEVDPLHGQKTGMFLDQRENRRRVGALARGARVLDLYTYAGGFALACLRGGAASATCVDSSARALERVARHGELNGLGPCDLVEMDAFRYLEQARPRSFDLVIVDPPKFARARKDVDAAFKAHERLNALALGACAPEALLVTCSCSQHVAGEPFERMLSSAAVQARRPLTLLDQWSQGPDHPLPPGFAEGRYLTVALCRVA